MEDNNFVRENITIEGARIWARNFSGKEGKFNAAGRRNFCLFIDDPVLADNLRRDGWNVRKTKPRDEYEEPEDYMQVAVAFGRIPPNIMLIVGQRMHRLDEDEVNILDWAEILNVDLIIRPYNYDVSGRRGVKAYLKTMYVTVAEDRLAQKYRDMPDSAQSSIGSVAGDISR